MPPEESDSRPETSGPTACPTLNATVSRAMPEVQACEGSIRRASTVTAVGPAMKEAPKTIAEAMAAPVPCQSRTGNTPIRTTADTSAGDAPPRSRPITRPHTSRVAAADAAPRTMKNVAVAQVFMPWLCSSAMTNVMYDT
jgi:hypothetical protein